LLPSLLSVVQCAWWLRRPLLPRTRSHSRSYSIMRYFNSVDQGVEHNYLIIRKLDDLIWYWFNISWLGYTTQILVRIWYGIWNFEYRIWILMINFWDLEIQIYFFNNGISNIISDSRISDIISDTWIFDIISDTWIVDILLNSQILDIIYLHILSEFVFTQINNN
jgi:hypothetical protein